MVECTKFCFMLTFNIQLTLGRNCHKYLLEALRNWRTRIYQYLAVQFGLILSYNRHESTFYYSFIFRCQLLGRCVWYVSTKSNWIIFATICCLLCINLRGAEDSNGFHMRCQWSKNHMGWSRGGVRHICSKGKWRRQIPYERWLFLCFLLPILDLCFTCHFPLICTACLLPMNR